MSNEINEEFLLRVIDIMWSLVGKEEYRGLTAYQVALKIGLNHEGARKIEKMWDGPVVFP